ncbi:hypothetical protein RXV94_09145 [Yeosuana sp. MJ-SS3]|uniref:Bacterial repeat domain-containing protein n=1 Tax=Gilvirhabdus luticola TaxID=3079858 RepID=A0ABU3U7D9_9FLAO|nr:hypothetical protein [Yeosuana sp. MJ-SS3]MDU8886324.1 hypothetical protein [Yeosuana sp. MJ-SS3]
MKVFKSIIVFEDYNYVEGYLELKISGTKLSERKNQEQFSVESILSSEFIVSKKYISPNKPEGITKNHVFTLKLPFSIPTFLEIDDNISAFNANFDEIIIDDEYVSEDGFLQIKRYNTVKDGNTIYSTFKVKAYGLKKNIREEIDKITKYEIFSKISGRGLLEILPLKDYYDVGEKVTIKAIPDKGFSFKGWKGDFITSKEDEVEVIIEKDVNIEAFFTDVDPNPIPKVFKSSDYGAAKTPPHVEPKGCLASGFELMTTFFSAIWYLFLLIIFIGIIITIINALGWYSLVLFGFFMALWLLPRLFSFIFSFSFLRNLLSAFFVIFMVVGIFNFFKNIRTTSFSPRPPIEIPKTTEEVKENTSIDYVHYVEWEDYEQHKFSTYLRVNSDFVNYENLIKRSIPYLKDERDYSRLLNALYLESEESFYHVFKSLDSIKARNNIPHNKFPEVIVTMVQSIPYYAILDSSCSPFDYQDESIRQLLLNSPCQGYVKHGIKTPAEFLKDIKGDCDTRTLFLFSILKHYNYDVAIFGSEHYKHSLLGINYSTQRDGIYKEFKEKKYYLWETTSKGFEPGNISPEIWNTNYWQINLN